MHEARAGDLIGRNRSLSAAESHDHSLAKRLHQHRAFQQLINEALPSKAGRTSVGAGAL